jgi:uncharacterized membrane protein
MRRWRGNSDMDAHRHTLAWVQVGLSAIGALIAIVLASFHYSEETSAVLCTGAGGCSTVNSSPYSTVAGVPIAVIGLGAYLVIGGLAFLSTREGRLAHQAPLAVFGLSLVGVLYSAYLTYLELFVIHAICPWCVASAVVMLLIWVTSIVDSARRRRWAAVEAEA